MTRLQSVTHAHVLPAYVYTQLLVRTQYTTHKRYSLFWHKPRRKLLHHLPWIPEEPPLWNLEHFVLSARLSYYLLVFLLSLICTYFHALFTCAMIFFARSPPRFFARIHPRTEPTPLLQSLLLQVLLHFSHFRFLAALLEQCFCLHAFFNTCGLSFPGSCFPSSFNFTHPVSIPVSKLHKSF